MTTTPAQADLDTLKAAVEAVKHLTSMMATNSRDWGQARDDAWFYGIAVGWSNEDPDDPEWQDCLPELAARHGWTPEAQDRLRALRAGYASVPALLDELATYKAEVKHADAEREEAERNRDAAREELGTTTLQRDTWHEMWQQRMAEVEALTPKLAAAREELAKTRADVEKLTTALDIVALREIRQAAELAKTRAELANATILLIEAVQHSGLPATTRQRINGLLAEANPATTAEPADEPKATCGHAYIGNEGEFTCDLYAPHNGKQHWNSLAEFAWTDERAA